METQDKPGAYLRADHLSVYGYHRKTTPFLEKLAENAAVYEKSISPAPWTPSAHASLLTGLLPAEHGTDGEFLMFDPPSPSLAEILKGLGYKTAAIVNNPQLGPAFGWNRGFDYYGMTWKAPKTSIAHARWIFKRRPEDWIWSGNALRTVSTAKRWWASTSGKPRFLFLNFIDPHSPYGDFHPYKNFFLNEVTEKAPDISNDSEDYDAGLVRAEGDALDRVIAFYDADIKFLDYCLGLFFQWLEERSDLDRCIIVVTSDHGERLGERGLLGHQLGLDKAELSESQIVVAQMRYQGGYLESLKNGDPHPVLSVSMICSKTRLSKTTLVENCLRKSPDYYRRSTPCPNSAAGKKRKMFLHTCLNCSRAWATFINNCRK